MAQLLTNKSRLLEKYVQVVREDGLNTNKNVNIGINTVSANLWVAGNVTVGGTITSTGSSGSLSPIVDVTASTLAPTASQSKTVFLLDRAAGVTVTLPVPTPGIEFNFVVVTTVTSNNYKIITDAGTTLLAGIAVSGLTNTANKQWVADGSTDVAVTMNGTTTGGIIGSSVSLRAVQYNAGSPSGLWIVTGMIVASGTTATVFTTS
jgi:hypothetical protein